MRANRAQTRTRVIRSMTLNDLLRGQKIQPEEMLVLRHRPIEPELRKVLPWLAAEKPEVYNAYQQTQGEKLQARMQQSSHVASFIGHEPGKALFIGLYAIGNATPLTHPDYWQVPAHILSLPIRPECVRTGLMSAKGFRHSPGVTPWPRRPLANDRVQIVPERRSRAV